MFTRSGTTWTEQEKLTASDGAADDNFGVSVSVDGDTAVIGAPQDEDNGWNSGSAYVYLIDAISPTVTISAKDSNNNPVATEA